MRNVLPAPRVIVFAMLLAAYGLLGFHMLHGKRSLTFQQQVKERLIVAKRAYAEAMDKRQALERRVARLREETLDKDMLDEKARLLLGFVARDEILALPAPAAGTRQPATP